MTRILNCANGIIKYMTNREFITACLDGNRYQGRDRRNGHLYWDGSILYSYGRHYPLAFRIKDAWFINDAGYSSTTGRHISEAKLAVKQFYSVHLAEYKPVSIETVCGCLKFEMTDLNSKLATLSPRAFRQRERIIERMDEIKESLRFINS